MKLVFPLIAFAGLLVFSVQARADISEKQSATLKSLLAIYADKAKEEAKNKSRNPDSARPFTVEAGRVFYLQKRMKHLTDFSCSSCHTDNPANTGKHVVTNKPIKALAPSVNPERFVDVAKVQKSFAEHCFDLYESDCRAYEKGIYVTYVMSVK